MLNHCATQRITKAYNTANQQKTQQHKRQTADTRDTGQTARAPAQVLHDEWLT